MKPAPENPTTTSDYDLRRRWLIPPVLWAAFGALCVLFQAWVFIRWAADGNLRGYPFSGEAPGYLKIGTRVLEGVAIIGCILMIIACWRESRAAGHITLFAALLAGYFLVIWTDPYSGTFMHTVSANLIGVNYPSWGPYLPGWQGPTPQAQTLLEDLGYPWVVLWILIGLGIARLLTTRRPHWSPARVAVVTAVLVFPIDLVLEHAYMRFGGYGYPRALPYLTLFEGQWYQLPLTSPICMTFLAVMPIVLMTVYARPGHEVWLLDGSLDLPRRAQPWIRLLAGIGFANLCMLSLQLVMLAAASISYPIDLPPWYERPT
ncbi:spirocyclase AveC family protein [Nonomuraea longicatena]|uniref:Spirocyclase, AveC family n=1 Tax=Nonomuraea longicatena TaxID=83682 RepID=A0ABN1NV50_9ACTN